MIGPFRATLTPVPVIQAKTIPLGNNVLQSLKRIGKE
jgi:hypothetical protein